MPARSEKQHRRGRGCRIAAWIGTVLVAVGLFGCSRFHAFPDASDPAAEQLFRQLRQQNDGLEAFKGLGRLNLQSPAATLLQQRVAWVGALPANLRIDILGSGSPAIKLAVDGDFLYVVDLTGQFDRRRPFRKIKVSDPDLKRLLSMSIKASELVSLLAGKIPPVDFDAVRFGDGSSDREVLVLGRRWTGVVQKIQVGRHDREILEVARFDRDGGLRYRARFERLQTAGSYRVPALLVLTGPDDARIQLKIDRFVADAAVTPDMFRLEKPGGRPVSH